MSPKGRITPLEVALLRALPPPTDGAARPGRHFGRKGTRVLARALDLSNPPSVEALLTGARAANTEDEARTHEAYAALVSMTCPRRGRPALVVGHGHLGAPDSPPADHFYVEFRQSAVGAALLAATFPAAASKSTPRDRRGA